MGKPVCITYLRHGMSKLNSLNGHLRRGELTAIPPEARATYDSRFPLNVEGRQQPVIAGQWLKTNVLPGGDFTHWYVSPYCRTLQTAYLLGLPNADWRMDDRLREIDWGTSSIMTDEEREELFPMEMELLRQSPFSASRPGGGESAKNVVYRGHDMLGTIYRECEGGHPIIVCHGEVMAAFRHLHERHNEADYVRLKQSQDPFDRIHNCQILQYSRLNPETNELEDSLNWTRSVCPWDLTLSSNEWRRIERKTYTNSDLAAYIENFFGVPA